MGFAIEVNNLFWKYPSFVGTNNPWSISGVNLEVERGEIFGITGASGAGKTTLCRLLLGLLPHGIKIPFQQINHHIKGTVRVLDEIVTQIDESANVVEGVSLGRVIGKGILAPRIGMVMQDPENQFLQMSLLHELAFGMSLKGMEKDEILYRAKHSLELVGLGYLWEDAEYIHPLDLSGGQKQRIAIAAFLCLDPEILVLDEPTSDLDPQGKHEIIKTVQRLKEEEGKTIILVEHDPELLHGFCDRIALLDQGQIVSINNANDFFRQPAFIEEHGVSSFEVTRIALSTGLTGKDSCPVTIDDFLPALEHCVVVAPELKERQFDESVIVVENMFYRYPDGTLALKGADLNVNRGEMVALLGINGSGKTTLAKILAGIYQPGPGLARVLGADLSDPKVRKKLPQHVGYVFQNPDHQIFTRKVYDEVNYGLENLGVPPGDRDTIIRKTLDMVGLTGVLEEDPLFLGKGQRQRLAVASVLAMGPEILIVDEPTTGQDYRMIKGIMDLLVELQKQRKTVLIITHDMSLVSNYCDRAIVMLSGKTVFDGTPRDLFVDLPLIEKTHLWSPQSVRLSLAMRASHPEFPILLNVEEWIEALSNH